jgi:hypothetical protein
MVSHWWPLFAYSALDLLGLLGLSRGTLGVPVTCSIYSVYALRLAKSSRNKSNGIDLGESQD